MEQLAYQIIGLVIGVTALIWLWKITSVPRWQQLHAELDNALDTALALDERKLECARQGVPVPPEVLNDVIENDKLIKYLREQIEECV